MSTFELIKKAIDDQATAFDAFKKTNDEQIAALKKGDEAKAKELGEKLGKIESDVQRFSELKASLETEMALNRERIEELESRQKSPGKTAQEKLKDEYKGVFFDWIRSRGQSREHEGKMIDIAKKDITIGTAAAGGYAVPEEISRNIDKLERKFSPVRDLVKVVDVGTSDYKELISIRGATSGWVGETGSRTATNTPQLREVVPTHGELYAYPQISEWSLDDIFFNVEEWLTMEVADEFAYQEGVAVISGNGTSKPTGMTNTAPVATSDDASPKRAAAAYQYVLSGDNSPAAIDGDSIIDLVYTLNSRYRANASFVMNSATAGAVRKLKDTTNQYLWQPGLQSGEPDRLLGYTHRTWEQMPDIGGGALPIAFGDFRRGYTLANRTGLRITRDDVTNVGHVRFYVRRREGGIVTNNDAIKFLKCL